MISRMVQYIRDMDPIYCALTGFALILLGVTLWALLSGRL